MFESLTAAGTLAAMAAPMYARYKWRRFNSVKNRQFGTFVHSLPVLAASAMSSSSNPEPPGMVVSRKRTLSLSKAQINSFKKRLSSKKMRRLTRRIKPRKRRGYGKKSSGVGRRRGRKMIRGYMKKKRSRVSMDKFNKYGVAWEVELQGTVNDPSCVYQGTSGMGLNDTLGHVIQALMRKLFEKAGIRIQGSSETISGTAFGAPVVGGNTLSVDLVQLNKATGATSYAAQYTLVATSTLSSVANQFYPAFQNWSSGAINTATGDLANLTQLYGFVLREAPAGGLTSTFVRSELRFGECFVEVFAVNEVRLQNRSSGADGGEQYTDIQNQPMHGKVYMFNGIPRVRAFEQPNYTGAQRSRFTVTDVAYGVTAFGVNADNMLEFKNCPSKGYFQNCKAVDSLRINPGEVVRKSFVYHQKSISLEKYVHKLRVQFYQVAAGPPVLNYTDRAPCPYMLVGLEDVIGVDNVNPLLLAWDIKRKSGVCIYESKKRWCKTAQVEVSIEKS